MSGGGRRARREGTTEPWFRSRFGASPFAVLATHGADDRLDLVPCCFALIDLDPVDGHGGEARNEVIEVVSAVDHKPKRSSRLARLVNIERNSNASMLVDHRDAKDWSQLWWVRVAGTARVVDRGDEWSSAVDALVAKYAQYREVPPTGPAIRLRIERWAGWAPQPGSPTMVDRQQDRHD